MWERKFWKDLTERSLWTFVQAFGGVLIATQLVDETNWDTVLVSALIAGGLAVLKSIAATRFGNQESAALPETQPPTTQVARKG